MPANRNILYVDSSDLPKLIDVLGKYREVSRKSWDEILQHEAKEWSWELWEAFKKISPSPSAIYERAKTRGFSVNRKSNSLTKANGGVSWAAEAAADNLLGGEKSDLFRVEVNANGVFIKPVRFSSRKSEKFLTGGRSGRKFSDSAKRAKNTSAEAIAKARQLDPTVARLNRRALSVGIELSLRGRAAKGGTMALQWLPKVFKRRKSATVHNGPIITRSAQGIPLGIVEFERWGDASSAKLQGLVPGTARQAQRHAIVSQVEAARVSDRMDYILRKLDQAKARALASRK